MRGGGERRGKWELREEAYSVDRHHEKKSTYAFVALYVDSIGAGITPLKEPTLMIAPLFLWD